MELTKNKKLSVVQIIDRLNIGGAERVLVTISNVLQENGHHVAVVTAVEKGPLVNLLNEKIAVIELKRKWKWNPIIMYRLIKAIKHFDIIHVHSRHNLRYIFLAKTLFRLNKKIFYHEHHGYRVNTNASKLEKKIFPETIFIAVSEALKQWAITKAGVNSLHVFTLPNIVHKEKNVIPQKNEDRKQLLMVANFVPVKNLSFVVSVFEELIKQHKDGYHLTIIGAIADVKYFETIISLITEKGLKNHISFLHDEINVQKLLQRFDLALHTATSESGPLVLIEYIAQGLPFITYDTGEVAQQIKKHLPACVMQNFDVELWANRIQELLTEDKHALKEQILTLFDTYYSEEAYYEKCLYIYNKGLEMQ